MSAKLIAFYSSAMGAGKTTAARHLSNNHAFTLLRFAGPLKAMTLALLTSVGYNHFDAAEFVDGRNKEVPIDRLHGFTARRLMQTLGTEWGRETLAPNFWLSIMEAQITPLLSANRSVTVDDVRYPNEAELIHRLGGKMVYVERPGITTTSPHASEGGLSAFDPDFTLPNHHDETFLQSCLDQYLTLLP